MKNTHTKNIYIYMYIFEKIYRNFQFWFNWVSAESYFIKFRDIWYFYQTAYIRFQHHKS